MKKKVLRITTVPISLNVLLRGQLAFVKSQGFEVYTVSAKGPEIDEMSQREGVKHHCIPMTRSITPLRDLASLVLLVKYIQKIKPDIVHTHTPKAGLLGMLASAICKVPCRLHTVAGLPLMEAVGFKFHLLKFTEYLTYKFATGVYPNSANLKDYIAENIKVDVNKLHIIGYGSSNGINLDYFKKTEPISNAGNQLRLKYNIKNNQIVFTFIGRVVRDKGVNELVHAFKSLSRKDQNIYLLIVGDFESSLDPLEREVLEEIETNTQIITTGFQKDIRPYLAITDVFVFPTYREGFPNVLLQACAMGVPCIATDINGCNEIITSKEHGLLIQPKSVDALVNAMTQLWKDIDLKEKYGTLARSHVAEKYDQQYVWKEIIREYKKQLSV